MAKKKIKKSRVVREIADIRFKEVKSEKKDKDKEKSEEESALEKDIEGGFSSDTGKRTAPVLNSENSEQNSDLEATAASAPAVATTSSNDSGLYSARNQGTERGYGQDSYTRNVNYAPQAQESARLDLLENQGTLSLRESFARTPQQTSWAGNTQANEAMRNERETREIRGYKDIERKSIEESQKAVSERRKRMAV